MQDLMSASLPQRFAWVRSAEDSGRALSLLAAVERQGGGAPPPDVTRQESEALTLSACRAVLNVRPATMRLIRFTDVEIQPGTGKRCSGFHIYDIEPLKAGRGNESSLVTVVYVPIHGSGTELPLPLMHRGQEAVGTRVVTEINEWAQERFGTTAAKHLGERMRISTRAPSKPTTTSSVGPSIRGPELADAALAGVDAAIDVWILGDVIEGVGELLGALLDGW